MFTVELSLNWTISKYLLVFGLLSTPADEEESAGADWEVVMEV